MAALKPTSAKLGEIDHELIIIGAGIAGINASYRYQEGAPKGNSYAVLESRNSLGGTWDLFRYPGIRSDSDIFTFAFRWNPWPKKGTMASGEEIMEYLTDSAKKTGIYDHIKFGHKVLDANWESANSRWAVTASVGGSENTVTIYSRFVYLATGYYDYEEPLKTTIPGLDNFQGKVLHPQFWPKDLDYENKEVTVIGSGATAVTIVPSMTDKAKHVTMLQRSPTYIFPLAQHGIMSRIVFALFPQRIAYLLHRLGWVAQLVLMIQACKYFPRLARLAIRHETVRRLPKEVPWDPHFNPRYNPWEQRLCASRDGDIFDSLSNGKASVVTDTIETVTKSSIKLTSGQVLHPDIIVTATGLKLLFAGGANVCIDGNTVDLPNSFLWKGTMLQNVPNLFFTVGFENASWTLGCDCAAFLMVRVLQNMKSKSITIATPRLDKDEAASMVHKPLFSLKATYLQEANKKLPHGGTGVWEPRTNYPTDLIKSKYGDIETALEMC